MLCQTFYIDADVFEEGFLSHERMLGQTPPIGKTTEKRRM